MVNLTSEGELLKCGTFVVDIERFWWNGQTVNDAGTIHRERLEANVVLELISINELGNSVPVASLQIRGIISPQIGGGGVIEAKKRHCLYIVGQDKANGTGGPIVIPEDHYAFDVGIYLRGDSDGGIENLTFDYSYHVEHETREQLEIPKSKTLQDFGTW